MHHSKKKDVNKHTKCSSMEAAVKHTTARNNTADCLHDIALVKFLVNIHMITKMATAYLTLWKIQETVSDQNLILVTPTRPEITPLMSVKSFWIFTHTSRVLLLISKQPKEANINVHMINPPQIILYLFFIILHTLFFQYQDEKNIVHKTGFLEVSHVGHCRKKVIWKND